MIEKFKYDKLKIITVILAVMIFFVGLVVTISNSGETYAVGTESSLTCDGGLEITTYAGNTVCCPSSSNRVNKAGDNYYCISSNLVSNTDDYVGVDIVDSSAVCSINSAGGILYDDICSVTLGSQWSVIEDTCLINALEGKVCQCKASLSVCGATLAKEAYCSNGGVLTDDGCQVVTTSEVCNQCNSNSNILEWGSTTNSNCGGGWHQNTNITESNCVTYTISYNANGGSGAPSSIFKSKGNSVTLSSVIPTRDGYTFLAWNTKYDGTGTTYASGGSYSSNANAILYAQWKEDIVTTYTVSYNANGGSGAPSNQTKTNGVNLTLSSTKPTWSGHTFLSWNTKSDGSGTTYASGGTYSTNASVTLYAQWKEDSVTTYTVSYNANGGSGAPSNQTKTNGVSLTLSSTKPAWSGHTFLSWNTKSDGSGTTYASGSTYSANASVTLYAQWKEDSVTTYTVSYDANGGSGAPSSQTGTTITISSTKPTMTGYTFVSWNTKKDGTGTTYTSGSSVTLTKDVVLYAQYKANEYNISYTLNGGTVTGNPSTATYDSVVEIKNPTKDIAIYVYDNKNDATIGKINADGAAILLSSKFDGWTSSTINTSTAYHGTTLWSNGNIKVTDTTFLNLTPVNGATVTMVANWTSVDVTLPTVSKDGYTCKWNAKADGTGTDYSSGGKYTSDSNSTSSVNLYAICDELTNVDDEIGENVKTGDILIVMAWLIGIGTLCYSVYYFRSRKVDM